MSASVAAPSIAAARAGLAAGRFSAVELVAATLAEVERRDPELNAYLHLDPEGALAAARGADAAGPPGPLAGMPICVKDIIDVAGMPTSAGAAGWSRHPAADATAVARLRAAGAVSSARATPTSSPSGSTAATHIRATAATRWTRRG